MPKKKKTRRSAKKYSALIPELNLKTRQHLIDYDYIDKLSEKDKAWLNQFTAEYVANDLDRKDFENNLVNTEEWKQECDRVNNARKNDLYTRLKVVNKIDNWEDYKSRIAENEDLDSFDELDNRENSATNQGDSGEGSADDL